MLSEKKYYPVLKEFISQKYNCIGVDTGKGDHALGLVDVLGAYETSSSYLSDVEVVALEVKLSTASFGKSLGQILGYSIFGERCYLAITFKGNDTFSSDQVFMANHLGVGLIRVPLNNYGEAIISRIEVVLSSKKHESILAQKLFILHAIGITKCVFCGVYGERKTMNRLYRQVKKPALFVPTATRKIYVCDKCNLELLPDRIRGKINNMQEAGKKAARTKRLNAAARITN